MAADRPGLQTERTALSWLRTALTALALAAVSLKTALSNHHVGSLVSASLAALAAATLYLGGMSRSAPGGERAVLVAAVAVLAAVTATAVVIIRDLVLR